MLVKDRWNTFRTTVCNNGFRCSALASPDSEDGGFICARYRNRKRLRNSVDAFTASQATQRGIQPLGCRNRGCRKARCQTTCPC
jgi:hypothetical protein